MARWRDIKQGNSEFIEVPKEENLQISSSIPSRIKAFIVDMFMIMMPLAYLTTYVFLGGKDEFQESSEARWTISLIYGFIIIIFWVIKGQTPGHKAYDLILVDEKTKKNISVLKAIIRYIAFLFSAVTVITALLPFFRKDKKTFQDLITNTIVIHKK